MLREFLKLLWQRLWWNLFLIVMWNFYILQLSWKLCNVHWYISKSNSSRNFQKFPFNWNYVGGTLLKTNFYPNFLKAFWKFWKISRKSSVMDFLFSMLRAWKLQISTLYGFEIPENSSDRVAWEIRFYRSKR